MDIRLARDSGSGTTMEIINAPIGWYEPDIEYGHMKECPVHEENDENPAFCKCDELSKSDMVMWAEARQDIRENR